MCCVVFQAWYSEEWDEGILYEVQGSYLWVVLYFRPDILKNKMKVFFVKYNDSIYVLCCISGLIFWRTIWRYSLWSTIIQSMCCVVFQAWYSEEQDEGVLCEEQWSNLCVVLYFRPDIMKNKMVFFVKYNYPIFMLCCISGLIFWRTRWRYSLWSTMIQSMCCVVFQAWYSE